MAEGGRERRLAAIVAVDVAGYSRLMGADEQGTLAAMTAHRDAMAPLVEAHAGRLVGQAGDGLLYEYPSVVEAVTCSMEMQAAMAERNQDIPDDKKMFYRIGINLGDVLVEGDDIFGDGVNVAARIEALAEPGGICISRSARDQVRDRMSINLEDMGEVEVKNIARPVRVFRVRTASDGPSEESPSTATATVITPNLRLRYGSLAAAVVAVAALAALLLWQKPWQPVFTPALALPDRPSIAVLPFNNMSDDKAQEYFVDGMTEDLITDLAKVRGLFVIARNSVFTYKGKAVDIRKVAEQLGVRYVLEGSVRRAGDAVRINAQLIDAVNGRHIWAERYDGSLKDVFQLQDKVTRQIVAALSAQLTDTAKKLEVAKKAPVKPEAYDLYLQGRRNHKLRSPKGFAQAIPYYERAIALDPNFGRAYAALSWLYFRTTQLGWSKKLGVSRAQAWSKANQYLKLALAQDSAQGYRVAAHRHMITSKYDAAIAAAQKALSLEPNDVDIVGTLAWAYFYAGMPNKAKQQFEIVRRLDPNTPPGFAHGLPYLALGDYDKAAEIFRQALLDYPEEWFTLLPLTAAQGHLGRLEKAKKSAARLKKALPKGRAFTVQSYVGYWAEVKDPRFREQLAIGLGKAGIPELPASFDKSKYVRLNGEQIRRRLFATTYTGRGRGPFTVNRKANGDAQITWQGGGAKSFAWIEDDRICRRMFMPAATTVTCSQIFKSHTGTDKDLLYDVGGRMIFKLLVPEK